MTRLDCRIFCSPRVGRASSPKRLWRRGFPPSGEGLVILIKNFLFSERARSRSTSLVYITGIWLLRGSTLWYTTAKARVSLNLAPNGWYCGVQICSFGLSYCICTVILDGAKQPLWPHAHVPDVLQVTFRCQIWDVMPWNTCTGFRNVDMAYIRQ